MAKSPTPKLRPAIREVMAAAPHRRLSLSALFKAVCHPNYFPDADPDDVGRELSWNIAQGYVGETYDQESEVTTYALTHLGKQDQGVA